MIEVKRGLVFLFFFVQFCACENMKKGTVLVSCILCCVRRPVWSDIYMGTNTP